MPDIKTYYHAVHLSRLIDWCRHRESKLWTQIEQAQSSFPLNRTPWCHEDLPFDIRRHPLIGCTISLCAHLFSQNSLSHANSSLRPILGNPLFTPGMSVLKFHTLRELGLHQASHFSTAGRWRTLTELSDSSGQYKLDFFRALQLHHFLNTINPPNTTDMPLTTLEEICTETGTILHTLSLMYKLLITPTEEYRNLHIDKWEEDLSCQFTDTQKQHILTFTHKSSICAKIQETNYKILTRWYRTPSVLKKFYPTTSDICWRCTQNKGTLLHIFWSCPRIKAFWGEVRRIIQKFTDRKVPDNPAYFLLHVTDTPARVYKKSVVRHLLDAAKACIPLTWKSTHPPTIDLWFRKIEEINQMEDLILTHHNRQERYSKTWQLWNIFKYSEEGQAIGSTPHNTCT